MALDTTPQALPPASKRGTRRNILPSEPMQTPAAAIGSLAAASTQNSFSRVDDHLPTAMHVNDEDVASLAPQPRRKSRVSPEGRSMQAVVRSRPSRSRLAGTAATAARSTRARLGSNNGAGSRRRPTAPRLHAAARAARGARKKREGGPTRSLYVAAAFFFQRAALFDYLLGEGCLSIMAARRPARTLAPSFDVAPPGGDIQTRGAGRRANEKRSAAAKLARNWKSAFAVVAGSRGVKLGSHPLAAPRR
ncbi:hypothetical protein HPB50_000886 [Hyalomma asiaticum]|uniref:Uncharacterized protein n=1 Tax=Hyalomma asiaticum TaxID=266040 RepID=A0ACB7SD05_HYAAI|nr:hypothetical protein HPB50_000886 [Hyalomma asiaticum]